MNNYGQNNVDYESYGKKILWKGTQHQIMYHFWLITKIVFVNLKKCTPLLLEIGDGFQKECIYILKIIQQDSLRYVTPDTNEGLSIQKLTNCEIRYDMSSWQYCTESVCFYIQNKTNVLDRFHLLVITMNINDDNNESKVCGISTEFIIKLTDLFS